jgi:hypothetical protein
MQYLTREYCEANRTKKASRGWKVLCPSCGGNNLWYTIDNGRCHCFECSANYQVGEYVNQTRTRIQLPVEDIRQFYENISLFYHKSIHKPQREYLHARGIQDDDIEFFKIGFCSNARLPLYANKVAKESGLAVGDSQPFLSDRIVFPYIAIDRITDLRGRCLGNEEPRYKSPYHQSSLRGALYPFNYDEAIKRAREQKLILITEGEIKTIFAHNAGFACVGLPGMTNWRAGCIIDSDIKVVVVFDTSANKEDRWRIDCAIRNMAKHIPAFSVATLPLLGEEKMDIDTFILKTDKDEFTRIIDRSIEYSIYAQLRKF